MTINIECCSGGVEARRPIGGAKKHNTLCCLYGRGASDLCGCVKVLSASECLMSENVGLDCTSCQRHLVMSRSSLSDSAEAGQMSIALPRLQCVVQV